ncbi:MAG: hypothetical protein WAW23_09760 [Candidatus Methanoperedens sp.]
MIGSDRIVENHQVEASSCLEEPLKPTMAISGKPEQKLTLVHRCVMCQICRGR